MKITMATRKRIRTLQNKIIKLAAKRNFPEYQAISTDLPSYITLAAMRNVIFPDYEGTLRDILHILESK